MGSKTIRYEKRLEKRGGSKWAKKCWEKVKKKGVDVEETKKGLL